MQNKKIFMVMALETLTSFRSEAIFYIPEHIHLPKDLPISQMFSYRISRSLENLLAVGDKTIPKFCGWHRLGSSWLSEKKASKMYKLYS